MNINERLKYLANQFDLKLKERYLKYVVLPSDEVIVLNYIFSPFHKRFGETPKERLRNIESFMMSEDYKNELKKRFHGGSMSYSYLKLIKKNFPHLFSKFSKTKYIAYSINENEVILHELIHCLLLYNKINFKKYAYDEGLVKYLEYKGMKELKHDVLKDFLKKVERIKDKKAKNARLKAIFFFKNLEDKTPKERKQFLLKLNKNQKLAK